MKKQNLLSCTAICAIAATGMPSTAYAQLEDEVIVTATKRAESAADIPIAVSALGEDTLDELRVDVFTDYLVQLPGVSAGGSGPGQNTIYIRGLASTTPTLSVAGVAGLAPNVAFYLDEQPLAQPGRNLDVYAADLERVEVLSGPQGTLFGASSQAGTVRMITNKPKIGVEEAKFSAGTSFTDGGEMSYKAEAVYNVPVTENAALRAVVYYDHQGGYVDNVPGTIDMSQSARYRQEGTVRSNGVPVSSVRAGFSTLFDTDNDPTTPNVSIPVDLSGITFLQNDNSDIAEDNINDTDYFGFRLSGLYEFTDDWSLSVGYAHQELDSDGVFYSNPDLGDYNVNIYEESFIEDEFDNVNWTLKGRLGMLDALYTGAFTKRKTDQRIDYTDYLYVAQYLPYYICDYYNAYYTNDSQVDYSDPNNPVYRPQGGTCQAPALYVPSRSRTEVQTHELRFNTPAEKRLRATFGGFYSDLKLKERNDFSYAGDANIAYGPFPDNTSFPDQGDGFFTDAGPYPADTRFRNDFLRTDEQFGIFGEGTFDLSDQFALTVGARYYDIEVDLKGTANSSFCNLFSGIDRDRFGTDVNDLYDGDGSYTFTRSCNDAAIQTFTLDDSQQDIENAFLTAGLGASTAAAQAARVFNELRAPDTANAKGTIFKVTGTWTPNDDMLFYATYSQGFRPGLLNRPGGATQGDFTVPFELDTDDVDNFELGWKTTLMDNQLRFNGNAFFVDISKLQTTIFDPSIVNLFFSANAADAEIKGVEGDITYAPISMEGLTVSGAFSFLDTEITEVLIPTNDVREGDSLAFAPKFQGNLRARYEWETNGGLTAHIMPQVVHTSSSFSDIIIINRDKVNGWTTFGLSAGLTSDDWAMEIFADNLTNKRNELTRFYGNDVERVTYGRPRTIGARVSYNFR